MVVKSKGRTKKEEKSIIIDKKKDVASAGRGLIIVITGNGKGKTTAAFGQALRAAGQGLKIFILQFMKGRKYGEHKAAKKYLPGVDLHLSGLDSFVMRNNPAQIDIDLAQKGLVKAKKAINSGKYDMVILDEINVALDFGLLDITEVTEMIKNKPPKLDLILTGRYAPEAIIELADTVSEVREIKHHYNSGIKDRAGIEY